MARSHYCDPLEQEMAKKKDKRMVLPSSSSSSSLDDGRASSGEETAIPKSGSDSEDLPVDPDHLSVDPEDLPVDPEAPSMDDATPPSPEKSPSPSLLDTESPRHANYQQGQVEESMEDTKTEQRTE